MTHHQTIKEELKASYNPGRNGVTTPPGLATTRLDLIRPEPVRWLVEGLIPLGKLTLFAGDGGHGKTTLTLELAAGVSTGRPVLGIPSATPTVGEVLLVSCEDDFGDTIVPRLLALGADLGKIHRVDGVTAEAGKKPPPFSLAHYTALEQELNDRPEVRLVVIDPAGAYIGRAGCDDHKDSELRSLLGPLAELAARRQVSIILVKHLNKGVNAKAVNKVSGSTGYVNAVRAAFLIAPDPEDNDRKFLLPLKFNIGSPPQGVVYRLQALDPDEAEAALADFNHLRPEDRQRLIEQMFRPEWLGRTDDDPDAVMAQAARKERGPGRVDECAVWLEKFLANYAHPSDEIQKAAEAAGFTFDNLKDAKKKLKEGKGLHNSNKGRFQGKWWSGFGESSTWILRPEPKSASPFTPLTPHTPKSPQTDPVGAVHSGESGESGESEESGESAESVERVEVTLPEGEEAFEV